MKVITQLPWEDLEREEDKKALQKYCIELAKKEDLLLKLEPQLAYNFDFDLENYVFLAHVLTKMDPELGEAQLRLVPDEVSDTEFWRNFFYHVELWRKEQGNFQNRLKEPKDEIARQVAVQEELRKANDEIKRLKEEAEAIGSPVKVDNDETAADLVNANEETAEAGEVELQAV